MALVVDQTIHSMLLPLRHMWLHWQLWSQEQDYQAMYGAHRL